MRFKSGRMRYVRRDFRSLSLSERLGERSSHPSTLDFLLPYRSAFRLRFELGCRYDNIGFRVECVRP
jgi:hypothetical protein